MKEIIDPREGPSPEIREHHDLIQRKGESPSLASGPFLWFSWDGFETWEPDNRHWVAPSSLQIYSDATVRMTAKHLAAMWRWPGPFDDGPSFTFRFTVDLLFEDQVFSKLAQSNRRCDFGQLR